jgi:phage terminase large subunit
LGEWGVLGNLILTNWEVRNIPKDPSFYASVSRGVDFGFKHPSAFLQAGIKDEDLYIYDEIYKSELTNNDLIAAIKKRGITKTDTIIADCAEPARIEEMNRSGLRVIKSIKGPSSVRDGIEYLRRRKIYIHPDCVNTIGEIQGWKYREDKMGNVLDEPVPFKDDAMAALRYLVQYWRRKEDNFQKNNPLEWTGPFKEKVKYTEKRDYNLW